MKLNFFARIYLAITDFRLFPYIVQKEKFVNALLYFLGFILLVSAILATSVSIKILSWLNDFMLVYDSQVEEFSIHSGELFLEKPMNFEFNNVQIYGDDTLTSKDIEKEINKIDNGQNFLLLAVKDGIGIGNKEQGMIFITYDQLNTNKLEVYEMLKHSLTSAVSRLSFAGAILCGIFVSYLISKLIHAVFAALSLLLLGFIFRTKYKFIDYLKVAFYVMTLPIIVELVALLVIGKINGYATFTYFILMYVYMYYAIRALKLDNIITTTQEKILGMKFTNGSEEDKKETDKQKEEDKKQNEELKEGENQKQKEEQKEEEDQKQNEEQKKEEDQKQNEEQKENGDKNKDKGQKEDEDKKKEEPKEEEDKK